MARRTKFSRAELQAPFSTEFGKEFPPILSPAQLASLLSVKRKTIYVWTSSGRLDGCYRKRGKHVLFWRDRVLDRIFNGPEWHI
jgi:excisionase family DNA binding protein